MQLLFAVTSNRSLLFQSPNTFPDLFALARCTPQSDCHFNDDVGNYCYDVTTKTPSSTNFSRHKESKLNIVCEATRLCKRRGRGNVHTHVSEPAPKDAVYKSIYSTILKPSESSNPSFLYPLESHSSTMFASTFIVLATGLATLVGAAPTDVKVRPLFFFVAIDLALTQIVLAQSDILKPTPDADAYVYICTDANFGGACVNYGISINVCSNLPAAFNDDISSLGPDNGLRCVFYLWVAPPSDAARMDTRANG
jgi:hypothetical protein